MDTIKKLYGYAPEKRALSYISMILSAVATIFSVLPYFYFWKLLRELLVFGNAGDAKRLASLIFLYMVLRTVTYLASLAFSHLFAFRVETNLKTTGLNYLLGASFSFFDTNPSGRTRQVIDDNASKTHSVLAHLQPDIINAVLYPIILITVSFLVHKWLGIIMIIATILGGFLVMKMFGDQNFMQKYLQSIEDMNSEIVEYIRGIKVVKIFNINIERFTSLEDSIRNSSKLAYNYAFSCRPWFVLFQAFFMSLALVIIPFGFYQFNFGTNVNEIIATVAFYATFAGLLFNAITKVMFLGQNLTQAKDSVDKLEDLFIRMRNKELESGLVNKMENYDIEFDKVSFKYDEDSPYILQELSFKLKEGRSYALIGSSGGGKSTIAKLISGFYDIDSGFIRIGGKEISEYSRETLAENIAFVFQNIKLFQDSIYENVRYGNEDASHEEIMQALQDARCDEILDKFETRENTIIGSDGVYLSGGETQRIAIARAILKDAPIIILDEASAAADPENEYEIQQAFSSLMRGKTVIMIAHRLTAIQNVDEILVIKDGEIAERGKGKDLLEKENSKYKHFMDLYNRVNEWKVV